jgi:hypothetical protein
MGSTEQLRRGRGEADASRLLALSIAEQLAVVIDEGVAQRLASA